jgi:polysaccharide biosynthesis/export protein
MKPVVCFALSFAMAVWFDSSISVVADGKTTPQASQSSHAAGNSAEKAPTAGSDFVIGAGDVLNIFVWKEAEVSRSVPVRPDGKISLPLVNDVQASGLTALELKKVLEEKLSKFFADPNVTVTVETVNSQKVTVMGEVTGAGPKPLAGPTRVMDILATSGFTPFAKTTKIYILRDVDGKQQRLSFNYKDYIKGKNAEQNILLRNGDTIVVP